MQAPPHLISKSLTDLHGDNLILYQLLLLTSPVPDPVEDVPMPQEAVLTIHNPMALIREMQEPAGHTASLQDVEQQNTIGDNDAVIQVIVDDELRCGEVFDVLKRIPDGVVLGLVPRGAVLVLLDEPELLGGVSGALRDLAVVRDDGLETLAELVAVDPVHPALD